ncbi:MAG: DegT/DnrJ/EryC1/StrS family aminotransferase, partial [Candidatus Bipolaricaulia bacterium]
YLGIKHAMGVASGTDALWLALKALGIGSGDKVLTSPFTFFATVSAVVNTGAQPVFADIDPETFNLDPDRAEAVLDAPEGERIKAIIPVHLYGQPADMEAFLFLAKRFNLWIVEDAAQAMGAEYQGRKAGTIGHIGCFSFFPTKNLGAFGDGGLVVTDNDQLAEKVRLLKVHGASPKYHHHLVGTNSRLDAVQAAILQVKLKYLDKWISQRQACAATYDDGLKDLKRMLVPPYWTPDRSHTYHQYTLRVSGGNRDRLRSFLSERDVGTAVYYPLPVHLQPALKKRDSSPGSFPEAERASREVLCLPIFPELTASEQNYILSALKEWVKITEG